MSPSVQHAGSASCDISTLQYDVLHLPCTKTDETPFCKLQENLDWYNHVLWHAQFQLREDECDPRELGLVRTPQTSPRHSWPALSKAGVSSAAKALLHRLLVLHRCIVFIEIDGDVAMHDFLLRALERNTSVRSLVIYDFYGNSSQYPAHSESSLCALASLPHIEKVMFRSTNGLPGHCTLFPAFRIDRTATSLRVLDVADLKLSQLAAANLVSMLIKNDTVTDLAVGTSVFTLASTKSSASFVDFLAKARKRLRKLRLKCADFCSTAQLERLVSAVAAVEALEEFSVDMAIHGSEGIAIFADVVAHSSTLRSLSITLPKWWDISTFNDHISSEQCHSDDRSRRWASALEGNCTLRDFTVDLLGCSEEECRSFFRALSTSKGLRHVTVLRLLDKRCVNAMCRIIKDSNLAGRVVIKDHDLSSNNVSELPNCSEVESVSLGGPSSNDADNICRALSILASCTHVSTLCLHLNDRCLTSSLYTALSTYIRAANMLRDFQLYLDMHSSQGETVLFTALSSGITFERFTFDGPLISEIYCQWLSEVIHSSRTLYHLSFSMDHAKDDGRFLRYLASKATENYNLLHVSVEGTCESDGYRKVLAEVTRRNSSLVARAACFVTGNSRTSYCARAIEFVSEHTKLAELVQEKAAIDEKQAREMVRRALASTKSLNGYMVAAGVVKDRVQCIAQPGVRIQIDQLNEYCWHHIRQYIKVADVLQV